MESAEDDPVGFALLRSGSGYVERLARQARRSDGAGDPSGGEVGISAGFEHHNDRLRDPLYGRPQRLRGRATNYVDPADDAVPFDVEAYNAYLDNGWPEAAAYDAALYYGDSKGAAATLHGTYDLTPDHKPAPAVFDYPNIRTHYYGDDCPGQHYNDDWPPHHND